MILNITYNKSTGNITLVDDEELMEATVNESSLVDNENELSIEISLNVSAYQTQFEEIEIDGDDN
jgi:hypothetical protein|tara:strand:- start:546 stop:740 length:195 start_codon:yes stop_codon:yes gene_type:complete